MAQVVLSIIAQADTAVILRDLAASAGVRVAADYAASLEALYDRLASFPDSGAPRPEFGRYVRMGVVSPFLVFYRHVPRSDLVGVIRLLHGSRNITRRLLGGGS
jgi:toxin ParE1/3/4